ncbi:MAG: smalltalk protein [Bacteroidaceae bacterium]|nr:smalltalk protein [Bacteroidaceae bacterium]
MENENKSTIWSKILKITITLLTAIATAFGLQACGVL